MNTDPSLSPGNPDLLTASGAAVNMVVAGFQLLLHRIDHIAKRFIFPHPLSIVCGEHTEITQDQSNHSQNIKYGTAEYPV